MLQRALVDAGEAEEEEEGEDADPETEVEAALSEGAAADLEEAGLLAAEELEANGGKKDEGGGRLEGKGRSGTVGEDALSRGHEGRQLVGRGDEAKSLDEGLELQCRSKGDAKLEDGGNAVETKAQGVDGEEEEDVGSEEEDEEEIEDDETLGEVVSEGEPFVQALLRSDYSSLSVEERLQALGALVNAVNDTEIIREALEERFEVTAALRRQMWAERKKQQNGEANAAEAGKREEPAQSKSQRGELLRKCEEENAIRGLEIGRDRRHNRYFLFEPSGAGDAGPYSGRIYFQSAEDWHWELIDSEAGFEALLGCLDVRGLREAALLESLRRLGPRIRTGMRKNGRGLPPRLAVAGSAEGGMRGGSGRLVQPMRGMQPVTRPVLQIPQIRMEGFQTGAAQPTPQRQGSSGEAEQRRAESLQGSRDLRSPVTVSPSAFSPFGGNPRFQSPGVDGGPPFQQHHSQFHPRRDSAGSQRPSTESPFQTAQQPQARQPDWQNLPEQRTNSPQDRMPVERPFHAPTTSPLLAPPSVHSPFAAASMRAQHPLPPPYEDFKQLTGHSKPSPAEAQTQPAPTFTPSALVSASGSLRPAPVSQGSFAENRSLQTFPAHSLPRPVPVSQGPFAENRFPQTPPAHFLGHGHPPPEEPLHAQVARAQYEELERLNRFLSNVGGPALPGGRPSSAFRPTLASPPLRSPTANWPHQQPFFGGQQPLPAGRFSFPPSGSPHGAMQSPGALVLHPHVVQVGHQSQAFGGLAGAQFYYPGPVATTPIEPPTVFLRVLGDPPQGPEGGALGPSRKLQKREGAEGALSLQRQGSEVLARFEEAEKWLWDVKTRAGKILDDETGLPEKLHRCEYCQVRRGCTRLT